MRLTFDEMTKTIRGFGLAKDYFPFNDPANQEREPGSEIILLETRKFEIKDGWLVGSAMDICTPGVYTGVNVPEPSVRIWTAQKAKANAIAKAEGFRIRLLDGECDIFIPCSVADKFLHAFGARVKKQCKPLTPEQLQAKRNHIARVNQARKTAEAIAA